MPSSATITSFYTFNANTKARASQVNTNFSNFRGHLLPISPTTITAINSTYDLGSSEYRWRTGYFQEIDLVSNTTTGANIRISGATDSSHPAAAVITVNSTRVAAFANMGGGLTAAAGVGQLAYMTIIASQTSTNAFWSTLSAICTLVSYGNPIEMSCYCGAAATSTGFGGGEGYLECRSILTKTMASAYLSVTMNGNTTTSQEFRVTAYPQASDYGTATASFIGRLPISSVRAIFQPSTFGTNTFRIAIKSDIGTTASGCYVNLSNCIFVFRELK